jgi:hypothetical protein
MIMSGGIKALVLQNLYLGMHRREAVPLFKATISSPILNIIAKFKQPEY